MLQDTMTAPVNFKETFTTKAEQAASSVESWAFYQTQLLKKRQTLMVDKQKRTRWLRRQTGRSETRW